MKNIRSSIIKEEIIKKIRLFFYRHNFHEVIVPILSEALPLEPNLYPFSTVWKTPNGDKTMYLSMSPERGIKHFLAEGIGNCFTISKSFRNIEQSGSLHSPEFLMLEWYREKASYKDIMADIEKLFIDLCPERELFYNNERIIFKKKFPVFSLKELFKKYLHTELEKIIIDEGLLFEVADKMGYQTKKATWTQIYDQLFVNEIENKLPKEPLFLIDFPAKISPLCQPQKNNPIFAERFEIYIAGVEIGNGNTENTDTRSVKRLFEDQQKSTNLPMDNEFLDSLKNMGDNSFAGVGIGIDRLTMILDNKTSIE